MSEVAVESRPGQLRCLARSVHPRQSLALAVGLAAVAAVSGRAPREVLVVGLAVLVVQATNGLGNDVADIEKDRAAGREDKPVAADLLPVGNATFAVAVLVLVGIPLSLQSGYAAGASLLLTLPVAYVHNRFLQRGALSWVGWVVTFALFPAYLSYGGWGGGTDGDPPTVLMTLAVALLGLCLHFLTSLPGLVGDDKAGLRTLPLRVALKVGAPRLLVVSGIATALATAFVLVSALTVGLRQ